MTVIYLLATSIVAVFGHGGAVARDVNALIGTDMSGVTMFILGLMLVVVLQAMIHTTLMALTGRDF